MLVLVDIVNGQILCDATASQTFADSGPGSWGYDLLIGKLRILQVDAAALDEVTWNGTACVVDPVVTGKKKNKKDAKARLETVNLDTAKIEDIRLVLKDLMLVLGVKP